jgi:hypothetical protein
MSQVFLSYAWSDVERARLIRDFLTAMGHKTWMDVCDLPSGRVFDEEIKKQIKSSSHVILCLSRHSVEHHGYVQREIDFALEEFSSVPKDRIFLIPVRLDECEIPNSLSRFSWVDDFAPNAKMRILQAIVYPESVDIDVIHERMRNAKLFGPSHELGRQEYRRGNYAEAEGLAVAAYSDIPNPHSRLNEMVAAFAQGRIIGRQLVEWVRNLKLEDSGHGESVIQKGF